MRRRGAVDYSAKIRAAVEDYTEDSLRISKDILSQYGVWEEA
jgi:hypothetical protein